MFKKNTPKIAFHNPNVYISFFWNPVYRLHFVLIYNRDKTMLSSIYIYIYILKTKILDYYATSLFSIVWKKLKYLKKVNHRTADTFPRFVMTFSVKTAFITLLCAIDTIKRVLTSCNIRWKIMWKKPHKLFNIFFTF